MSRATIRLRHDKRAWFGAGVVGLLLLMAIAAPLIARTDPLAIDLVRSLEGPSRAHWLGTDIQGRDVFARLVYGARVSLTVGIASQCISLAIGVFLGLLAGYYGKWIDEGVMRHGLRSGLPTVDRAHLAGPGVVVDEVPAAADPGAVRLGDAQRCRGRHGGVDRVATAAQDLDADPRRLGVDRGDRSPGPSAHRRLHGVVAGRRARSGRTCMIRGSTISPRSDRVTRKSRARARGRRRPIESSAERRTSQAR